MTKTVQIIVATASGRELGWTVCERKDVDREIRLALRQGYRFVRLA